MIFDEIEKRMDEIGEMREKLIKDLDDLENDEIVLFLAPLMSKAFFEHYKEYRNDDLLFGTLKIFIGNHFQAKQADSEGKEVII